MLELFEEEIGAIEAIYPECITQQAPQIFRFSVPQHESIHFSMIFPDNYPNTKPSIFDVSGGGPQADNKYLQQLFSEVLDSIYHSGDVVIFDLFTELDQVLYNGECEGLEAEDDHWTAQDALDRETAPQISDTPAEPYTYNEQAEKAKAAKPKQTAQVDPLAGWTISEPIVDRKSTFVAFATKVDAVEDVDRAVERLMLDKKLQRSAHAMRAYRIKRGDNLYQDCDDDGETAAGGRMLHLLSIMDATNVLVVCARWFGGVHIGPSRFKHINSATRDAVVKGGFAM